MKYRLDLGRWMIGRGIDTLFDGDWHVYCRCDADGECDRSLVLIERVDDVVEFPQ